MRKIGLYAVAAAFILAGIGAGVGAWAASSTYRPGEIAGDPIDPFQMMLNDARDLPVEHWERDCCDRSHS